jgi:ectoine hydroxylase-related dioxygenase (phytanoyl-CoA dioxygenase family)
MNIFGSSTATPSLTESIFGSSSSDVTTLSSTNDLFSKKVVQAERKRPRPSDDSCVRAADDVVKKTSPEKTPKSSLSPEQTLHHRRIQSQSSILDQLTISTKDYRHGTTDDEMYADVRSLMKHHGLVILRDAFSHHDVETIINIANNTQNHICNALDLKGVLYNSAVANTETFVYKEVAVRCKGRMDVRYDDEGNDYDNTTQEQKLPASLSLIEKLATSILHGAESPKLVYSGFIFSFPASTDQPWHTDGTPLFGTGITESLPSYAINIFVGLHDANELLVLGPTEFVVGSHHMDPGLVMDTMSDKATFPAVIGKGDILLYDYRICHRGTCNLSSSLAVATTNTRYPPAGEAYTSTTLEKNEEQRREKETSRAEGIVRQVLYQMYARPWFKEHLNFGQKSLFDTD